MKRKLLLYGLPLLVLILAALAAFLVQHLTGAHPAVRFEYYLSEKAPISRVAVDAIAPPEYRDQLRKHLQDELRSTGLSVVDETETRSADATLKVLVDVARNNGKYDLVCMYRLEPKKLEKSLFRGSIKLPQVVDPDQGISQIAVQLARELKASRTSVPGK